MNKFFFLSSFVLFACQQVSSIIAPISNDLTTTLRAPAYPLVTVDPYFNAWLMADNLYDDAPRHWTEKEFPMIGVLRVDGGTYRFMGTEKLPLKSVLSTSHEEKWIGTYTFRQPQGNAWLSVDFNDPSWEKGFAAFGTRNEPNLSTLWERRIYTSTAYKL